MRAGDWLTVERALWGGVVLLAAALRLWDLGGLPLQAGETAKALTSWQMLRGQGGSAAAGPLLIYGNALVFLAFGASDASARVLPALAGTALVGLPFLLREQIGRWGTLIAALLLAISPTLLYLGRSVDSQPLVAATALAVVACLVQVSRGAGRGWLYGAAVALGLLVLAGRDAYTMLLVLAGAAMVLLRANPASIGRRGHRSTETRRARRDEESFLAEGVPAEASLPGSYGARPPEEVETPRRAVSTLRGANLAQVVAAGEVQTLTRAALLAGAVVALGTTALLGNLHGVQEGLVTPVEGWLSSLLGGGQPWHFQLQVLLVYEPALLIFGVVGGITALRNGNGMGRFLVWWAGAALLVSALSGERPGAGMALAVVPLALLAGPATARVVSGLWDTVPRQELGIYMGTMLSLLALFWVATQFFTLPGPGMPATVPFGPFAVGLRTLGDIVIPAQIVFLLAALGGLSLWISPARLPELAGLLALVVLTPVTFHTAVLLNYAPYASPAELPVAARTAADVRELVRDVADTVDALTVNNRPRAVRVATAEGLGDDDGNDHRGDHIGSPLRWYLREQPGVRFSARPVADEALVIAALDGDPPLGKFAAQRYRLQGTWTEGTADLGKFWRWLTLREEPGTVDYDDVVLYVRVP